MGGIHGVFLVIQCPGSSVSTKSFNLTETEKRGSNLRSLYFWRKEQIWGVGVQSWIEEHEKAEGWARSTRYQ